MAYFFWNRLFFEKKTKHIKISTKAALDRLGLGPTYHMVDNFKNGHWNHWAEMEQAGPEERTKILKKILENYKSSIDFPTSLFYEDLLRANPSAKVLLTVRDSPEVSEKKSHDDKK